MVAFRQSAIATALFALGLSTTVDVAQAEELCSIPPQSFAQAKTDYPDLAFAIDAVEEYSIAAWYTDRLSPADRARMRKDMTTKCSEDARMTFVVYGIPNKDCNAGFSSSGSVKNAADYVKFLSELTTAVGDRKVLYVVEPDSVGLLAEDNGCGVGAGYLENLKVAVKALSANKNAELYVDVGYWTLENDAQLKNVVAAMKELVAEAKLKGIAINTSNYRSNGQMEKLCTKFQTAMGSAKMTCIIDTSRNFNEPSTTDWCNVKEGGIGYPPTSETNITSIDYFMWLKVAGESDGTCLGGPDAGKFFEGGFKFLWDQGYLVKELGMNTIADGGTVSQSSEAGDPPSPETTEDGSVTDAPDTSSSDKAEEEDQTQDESSPEVTTPTSGSIEVGAEVEAETETETPTETPTETGAETETEIETGSLSLETVEQSPTQESEAATTPSLEESPLKTSKCVVKSRMRK
ncbi:unnamed protein product [Hyaloperonospora brassicae]|uniref:Glucanase n=1 Tax=Hyaloperonospora brassicae TaxID=162125 RepID=A0AAV0URA6_HYABA|nr:unnamed protein product [Hyaloperonospora brassicae]